MLQRRIREAVAAQVDQLELCELCPGLARVTDTKRVTDYKGGVTREGVPFKREGTDYKGRYGKGEGVA